MIQHYNKSPSHILYQPDGAHRTNFIPAHGLLPLQCSMADALAPGGACTTATPAGLLWLFQRLCVSAPNLIQAMQSP